MLFVFQCYRVATDPHTDGRQTPASPVHHVEEEETRHGDEVDLCGGRLTNNSSVLKNKSSFKDRYNTNFNIFFLGCELNLVLRAENSKRGTIKKD